jgi:predicted membrane protein
MKMGHALFWGLLLILIGFSLIFKIVFNVDFPLLKIIIAFVFIFIGLRILLGGSGIFRGKKDANEVIFGEKRYSSFDEKNEYNVVFGKGVYDFRDIELEGKTRKIRVSTIFGSSEIKISRDTPVRILVDAAFAGVELPHGNSAVIGNTTYESPGIDPHQPFLEIKMEAVFAGVDVKIYD